MMNMDDRTATYEAERAARAARDTPIDTDTSDLSGVAQSDSLRMYLREIARIPLLSAQNELQIARRVEAGDRESRNQLI